MAGDGESAQDVPTEPASDVPDGPIAACAIDANRAIGATNPDAQADMSPKIPFEKRHSRKPINRFVLLGTCWFNQKSAV
jgi:hypothetical protein